MKLNAINVLEIPDTLVPTNVNIHSWDGNLPDQVKEAEDFFKNLVKENSKEQTPLDEEDLESCVEDGYFILDTYQVLLVWSE